MEFLWTAICFFLKFLNKSIQRNSDFGGQKYAFENSEHRLVCI